MNAMRKKPCAICGKKFEPKTNAGKICSAECRHKQKVISDLSYKKNCLKTLGIKNQCPSCGKVKLPNTFNIDRFRKTGKISECRACIVKRANSFEQREKIRLYKLEWLRKYNRSGGYAKRRTSASYKTGQRRYYMQSRVKERSRQKARAFYHLHKHEAWRKVKTKQRREHLRKVCAPSYIATCLGVSVKILPPALIACKRAQIQLKRLTENPKLWLHPKT